jgi:predicted negative regulator of RcsB-dependent stress response
MQSKWAISVSTLAVTGVLLTGCTSAGFFGSSGNASLGNQSALEGFASSTAAPTDGYGAMPKQPIQMGTTTGALLAPIRQAGDSIAKALQIKPKVSTADDPVKLDNQPDDKERVAADLHYHAGYFFESQQKFTEAAAHYRSALDRSPKQSLYLAAYGRMQDQLGNRAEAEDFLRRACELAPQDPAPLQDLAQCYARRQDLERAIQCLEKAVTLQPTNAIYRSHLARILIEAGRPDDAVRNLATVHGEANAQMVVASFLNERKRKDATQQGIRTASGIDPNLRSASWVQQSGSHANCQHCSPSPSRSSLIPTRLPTAN